MAVLIDHHDELDERGREEIRSAQTAHHMCRGYRWLFFSPCGELPLRNRAGLPEVTIVDPVHLAYHSLHRALASPTED